VEAPVGQLRHGVARLMDRSAAGRIDQDACEPRLTRLRQRLARLEAPRPAGADAAAVQTACQRILGRRAACATTVHRGVEAADWTSQRDRLRALVTRVEVARDDVTIVWRIDPYPGDPDPEKKSLQLCRGSAQPLAGQHIPE